ncbi:MAG: ABC transporter substrate-binding protein [Eubacteriaceae bacterium]
MKKKYSRSLFIMVICCIICSMLLMGCNKTNDVSVDPTNGTEVELSYTDSFSIIDYGNDIKLVTDAEGNKFLLVPEGQETPEIPDAADATVINTPLKQVIYCSTTQVSLLKSFFTDEEWGSIAGVTTDKEAWYIDEVKTGMEKGDITFVGGEGMGDPDFERMQSLNPDMVVIYTGDYGQQTTMTKMNELGIPCMVVNDYLEADDMGRLEWIKFLATFYSKDAEAAAFMAEKEALLEEIKSDIKDMKNAKVAWGMIHDGTVYVPNGGSYVAKQIEKAGGDYVFSHVNPDQGSSSQLTLEEFYEKGKEADVFIYSSNSMYMPSIESLLETAPLLKDFKSIENEEVYCFTPSYYMSLDTTVEGIKDLAKIFHDELYPDWEFTMYEKMPLK